MKMRTQKISGIIISIMGIIANVVFLHAEQINKSLLSTILMNISVLCGTLGISSSIIGKYKNDKFQFIWRFTLCLLFPLSASILVLENQQQIWLYSYFLGLIFFLFDLGLKHTDVFIILSLILAYTLQTFIAGEVALELQIKCFYGSVLCFILFNSYYISKFSKSTDQQIQKLRLFGGAIAHELRTPLSAIISGAYGLKEALPVFMEAYKLRSSEKHQNSPYESYQLEALLEAPDTIMQTAQEGAIMIDMLLMKIKTDNVKLDCSTCLNACSIFEQIMAEYPFGIGEKDKIKLNKNEEFNFYSNEKAFKHVIFNLLKNALYQIANHKKGEIEIWFTADNRHNTIHVKDTAIGIKEGDIIHIFTEAYKVSENGTGIGLPFCKFIVESSGGNIECKSVFGEYTEFILQFPTITSTKEKS